jgi:phosphohistidine phosphatase
MQLLIIRHAIAFERNPRRWPDDDARPLSPRGMARARQAATGLARLAPRPRYVLASPLTRTQETAAILARGAGWPRAHPCPQLRPHAPLRELVPVLAQLSHACVGIVGHEPDLNRLLAACLTGGARSTAFRLKKMGAALVEFPDAARAGRGELVWVVTPKILRAAR